MGDREPPAVPARFGSHTFALPSGKASVCCREDGIVQIDNTEVTPDDVRYLAAHIEQCGVLPTRKPRRRARG